MCKVKKTLLEVYSNPKENIAAHPVVMCATVMQSDARIFYEVI